MCACESFVPGRRRRRRRRRRKREEGGGRRGQREIDVFDDTIEDSGRLRAAAPR